MKIKRIFAAATAVIMILMLFTVNVSAASTKGISLSKSSVAITVGKTTTVKATVSGYKKCTIQWSSSDKSIATVAAGGKITGKKAGTATITVKIKGTDYKATCKVTVKEASSSSSSSSNKTISSGGTAMEFVENLKIGWNLGNSLDCSNCTWVSNELDYETAWGNPKTTEAMIKAVKKAGFNTIRIPVSWGDHLDSSNNISSAWMDRVQEVVDYAIDNGMYVILNTHHEEGWLIPTADNEDAVTERFTAIWKQIASRFKSYDEHLIFEGMNEPRTVGSAKEWTGGTSAERDIINNLNQTFVDTVRASGGNNKLRYLMITPYGTSSDTSALKALKIPDDDRIIVTVHAYIPYNMAFNASSSEKTFNSTNKAEIDTLLKNLNTYFISKDIPVIIGEFGSINKGNTAERAKLAKYYVSEAKKLGIVCVLWDNNYEGEPMQGETFGFLNRSTLEWYEPDIIEALMEGVE
ncbi:MAG: cellulase family glycosylhydrolase [Oscillospiraceae bacterium]|nr:cellulase family glycosylhydrolase [Oscillospiraceae bacterium]